MGVAIAGCHNASIVVIEVRRVLREPAIRQTLVDLLYRLFC